MHRWLTPICCRRTAAGAVSSLGSLGSTLSVEREWTKALCGGEAEELARLNAGVSHKPAPMQKADFTAD